MAKAAGLETVLPGVKRKGDHVLPAKTTATSSAGGKMKALTVKVSPDLYRQLRLHAVDSDMSHQDIIVMALEQYLG